MADDVLRRAVQSDVPAIVALVRQAYQPYVERIGREPAPMTADYADLVDNARVWVLAAPSGIDGVLVTRPEADHLLLENIAVAPPLHGRGLGRLLITRAEDEARGLGLTEVRLYTHVTMTENLRIYPALGYHETGRRTEHGFERVHFAKTLPPPEIKG